MLKNKAKPSKAKGKKKYTKLQKIQLHINAALGRPGPKVLPRLTDEEYLILQSKLLLLKNEQIGLSTQFQPQSGLFSSPQLLNESVLPQLPPDLPIGMNPAITSGYEIIQGNIIPAPIPDTLDRIGAQVQGIGRLGHQRTISNPVSEQKTPNSVQPQFGMGLAGGIQPRVEHSATPYKTTQIFKPPEYIGPQIAITQEEAAQRARAKKLKEKLDDERMEQELKKKTGKSTGRGFEGDISNRDLAAKRRYDKAKSKVDEAIGDIEKLAEKGFRGKFEGKAYDEKMKQLDDAVEVATRNLQQAEEELDRRATAKGLDAGRFKTPNIDLEGEKIATEAGGMTASKFEIGNTSSSSDEGLNITDDAGSSSLMDMLEMDTETYEQLMRDIHFSSGQEDDDDRYTSKLEDIPTEFDEDDKGFYDEEPQPAPAPLPPLPETDMAGEETEEQPEEPQEEPPEEPPKKKDGRGGARKNAGRKKGGKNKPKP